MSSSETTGAGPADGLAPSLAPAAAAAGRVGLPPLSPSLVAAVASPGLPAAVGPVFDASPAALHLVAAGCPPGLAASVLRLGALPAALGGTLPAAGYASSRRSAAASAPGARLVRSAETV